jgi:HSP20 family protein
MSLMRRDSLNTFDDLDRSMIPTMAHMMNRMRTLLNTAYGPLNGDIWQPEVARWLAVDVTSSDQHVIVQAELPGFKEDEIEVDVRDTVLTIRAESRAEREDRQANWHIRELRYGQYARSIQLPEPVHADKAEATLENGVLTVRLPKQRPSPIHRIAVKARQLLTGGKK